MFLWFALMNEVKIECSNELLETVVSYRIDIKELTNHWIVSKR
jgi:hypothetical protein